MSAGVRRVSALSVFLIGLLLVAAAGRVQADEFYRWQDDRGRSHFSDNYYEVPPQYRDQIEQSPASFEDQAGVSVVEGLDERYVPKDPNRAASREPAGVGFDLAKLKELQASPREMLAQVPAWMFVVVALAAALGLLLFLLLAAAVLRYACSILNEEPPGWLKAMGITLMQGVLGAVAQGTLQVALFSDPAAAVTPARLFALLGLNTLVGLMINVAVLRGMVTESIGKAIGIQVLVIVLAFCLGLALFVVSLAFSCAF